MNLPDSVSLSSELALQIARCHGLSVESARVMPSAGVINTVVSLDDRFVLRVPRHHPAHVEQAHIEAQAIPLAVAAGVRTPEPIAFDASLELVPVPYLITRHVDGQDLESSRVDPGAIGGVWIEVGRDLGLLHDQVSANDWPRPSTPAIELSNDADGLVQQRVDDGWFSYVEGVWLVRWLEKLADVEGGTHRHATHGDVQMSNILAGSDGAYQALLDWGCASCKDPVVDFMPMPLQAVPFLLRGHRQVAPLPDDANAERRILLGRLRTLLKVLPRGAAPNMTWGERPTAWLTDMLRFFQHPPSETWRAIAPDQPGQRS